ncbi:MAG: amidohydrolase [Lachnospiraceae bacterium]|jgi:5-methylthioadenosine/S-adenosylhomocysteine deaminase|nr:amidohydrolase [Lachnospiraceae bacterium]
MKTRLYNAYICTMVDGDTQAKQGEVWIDGDRIIHAGPVGTGGSSPDHAGADAGAGAGARAGAGAGAVDDASSIDARQFGTGSPGDAMGAGGAIPGTGDAAGAPHTFDYELDCGGCLILPGFKNAHTHSPMTFLRSFADDMPLLDWLQKQVFPMEAKLSGEAVYWFARLAILEYLTSGITANFDMYAFGDDVVRASVDSSFRTVMCGAISDNESSPAKMEAEYLRFNATHPRISATVGFHAEYTCSQKLMEEVAAIAHRHKAPVYAHNSETRAEVEQCKGRYGITPTALFDRVGLYDFGGGAYHCVHVDENDMDIFREKGIYVISNPGSNMKLASGIAPLCRMQEKGVSLALGTDGPASNNCLDFFREMFLATGCQKLLLEDASAMDAPAVLRMACSSGAHAMCLPQCDSLAPGKQADLVVIDLLQPNMQPINNMTNNLVYSGSKQNVKMTMVAGKVLYGDGQFDVGVPAAEIYAKAQEWTERIKGM